MKTIVQAVLLQLMLLAVTNRSAALLVSRSLIRQRTTTLFSTKMVPGPPLLLRNGMEHPSIGFGTYKVGFIPASASSAAADSQKEARSAVDCIQDALDVGYRCLECAEFYGNQQAVGEAISAYPRKDLFLIGKVWTTTIEKGPEAIRAQLDDTLRQLGTSYLDLYLIHWPVPHHHVTAYKTLLELRDEGKIRGVGVSNYAWEDFLELKENKITTEDLPLVNQIEINPFLYRKNTISKFQSEGVILQSYRSLRDGKAMGHPLLVELGAKYNKSPAQLLGRWGVQKGFGYFPKSVRRDRMEENARVFDFEVQAEDMQRLDALTTADSLTAFEELYRKCVNRDTSKAGSMDGVKMSITKD